MSFYVHLIYVPDQLLAREAMELARNCSPVTGRYWIFEGDTDYLDCRFEIISEGVTEGGLSDFTEKRMIKEALDVFGIDVTKTPTDYPTEQEDLS